MAEASGLADVVIGREDAKDGVGVLAVNDLRGQREAGRRVSLCGLGEDLPVGDFLELLPDLGLKMLVCKYPNPLGGNDRPQPVDCFFEQ